jgi:hypothetical protein
MEEHEFMGFVFVGWIVWLLVVWMIKAGAYWAVFRYRTIEATAMDCLRIAGVPLLISIIPIPLPSFLSILLPIGLAVFLTMYCTGVSFVPDGLFIPLGIEIAYRAVMWALREVVLLR